MNATHNSVITLDADNFELEVLGSKQTVLVDFWADWCPPCKAIGPIIDEVATGFEGIAKVGKVDVDVNKSLATQYGILSIPSLLFFSGGEIVERIQGLTSKSEITAKLTALSEKETIET